MNKNMRLALLPFAVAACAAGCVSLSKYNRTVQSLQASQTENAALKQDNDKLNADLEAARRELVDLAVDLKADLSQAQDNIAVALKRLDAVAGADASAASAEPGASASLAVSTAAVTSTPAPPKR